MSTKALTWASYCSSQFLETLAQEFCRCCSWENMYADDLVIITESLEELLPKLILWKTSIDWKWTAGKHKQNHGSDFWAKAPCASEVWQIPLQPGSQGRRHPFHFLWCLFQLDPQAIQCYPWRSEARCQLQVQVKQCIGQTRQTDGRLMTEVTVGREKLEVVPWFYYLGDCLSPGGSGERTTITRCCILWGKINKLLPVFTSRSSPITCRGRVNNGVMLHASEIWPPTLYNYHHLQWNNWAMSPWMRDVTTKDQISSQDLFERIQLDDLA